MKILTLYWSKGRMDYNALINPKLPLKRVIQDICEIEEIYVKEEDIREVVPKDDSDEFEQLQEVIEEMDCDDLGYFEIFGYYIYDSGT